MSMASSSKLLEYISRVSKEDIYVNGELWPEPKPSKVILTESFFHKDDCYMCGRCCVNEEQVWTVEGVQRIIDAKEEDFSKWGLELKDVVPELMRKIELEPVVINGKQQYLYVFPKDDRKQANKLSWDDRKESFRCHWLFEKESTYRCRMHPIRSITCGLPHLRFFYNSQTNSTTLRVSQYGRNWALKCPVRFGEYDKESTESRVHWLQLLDTAAKDLGIETYIPEILNYVGNGGRVEKVFPEINRKKLFTIGGRNA